MSANKRIEIPGTAATLAQQLYSNGYTPLGIYPAAKNPISEKWTVADREPLLQSCTGATGIGIRGDDRLLAVDCDTLDRDTATDALRAFRSLLTPEQRLTLPVRVGKAPKWCAWVLLDTPLGQSVFKGTYANIELRSTTNTQAVVHGTHPDTHQPYTWLPGPTLFDTPRKRLPQLTAAQQEQLITLVAGEQIPTQNNVVSLASFKNATDTPTELIPYYLLYCVDACDDYHDWYQIGAALHHQTDGSDQGYKIFDEWSKLSPNYGGTTKQWDAYRTPTTLQTPATFRTILKKAFDAGALKQPPGKINAQQINKYKKAYAKINDKNTFKQLTNHAAQNEHLTPIDRLALVPIIYHKHYELTQQAPKPDTIESKLNLLVNQGWQQNYAFSITTNKFINLKTGCYVAKETINDIYSEPNSPPPAQHAINASTRQVPIVDAKGFNPAEPLIYEFRGLKYANTYNKTLVPSSLPIDRWQPEHHQLANIIDKHFELLSCDPRDGAFIKAWCAHQVQHPGVKLAKALALHGVEGTGKSLIGELLAKAIGEAYAYLSGSTEQLLSDFNSPFAGKILIVIEELNALGNSKHKIQNKLKPLITDVTITINEKGIPQYIDQNVFNMIICTNIARALPISVENRRYFAVSSRFRSKKDLLHFKESNPEHFKSLALLRSDNSYAPFLRGYFEQVDLAPLDNLDVIQSALHDDLVRSIEPQELSDLQEMLELAHKLTGEEQMISLHFLVELYMYHKFEERPNKRQIKKTFKSALIDLQWLLIDDGHMKMSKHDNPRDAVFTLDFRYLKADRRIRKQAVQQYRDTCRELIRNNFEP